MDELTPKQAEFCRLVACGHNASDAYRQSHDATRQRPTSVHVAACKLMAKPKIKQGIRELLREARVEDVLSVGEHMAHILEDREAAKADSNHTAVAAFDRTLATILGMTNSTVFVAAEKSETDEQLITRLSGGDPVLEKHLRAIIGRDSFGNGEKDDKEDEHD